MAGEATGKLHVSLTVVAACSVSTRSLTLAPYTTGGAATGAAETGAIDVRCSPGTPASVYVEGPQAVSNGQGASVDYLLQADGRPWPSGTPLQVTGQGDPVHIEVSATVPAGQRVPPGQYSNVQIVRVVY